MPGLLRGQRSMRADGDAHRLAGHSRLDDVGLTGRGNTQAEAFKRGVPDEGLAPLGVRGTIDNAFSESVGHSPAL